jgi:excinuclease ABC subunit A
VVAAGQEVIRETAEIVATRLGSLPTGTRLLIGFDIPVVAIPASSRSSDQEAGDELDPEDEAAAKITVDSIAETLQTLRRRGYGRLLVDGKAVVFEEVDSSSLKSQTHLNVVVDRLRIEGDLRTRLTDSIETAYREGGGAGFAIDADSGARIDFSSGSNAVRVESPTKRRSHDCSRSTIRSARARPVMASAT